MRQTERDAKIKHTAMRAAHEAAPSSLANDKRARAAIVVRRAFEPRRACRVALSQCRLGAARRRTKTRSTIDLIKRARNRRERPQGRW